MPNISLPLIDRTTKVFIPGSKAVSAQEYNETRQRFRTTVEYAAEQLSLLTGRKIRAVFEGHEPDTAVWGEFFWFVVKDPEPVVVVRKGFSQTGTVGECVSVYADGEPGLRARQSDSLSGSDGDSKSS